MHDVHCSKQGVPIAVGYASVVNCHLYFSRVVGSHYVMSGMSRITRNKRMSFSVTRNMSNFLKKQESRLIQRSEDLE